MYIRPIMVAMFFVYFSTHAVKTNIVESGPVEQFLLDVYDFEKKITTSTPLVLKNQFVLSFFVEKLRSLLSEKKPSIYKEFGPSSLEYLHVKVFSNGETFNICPLSDLAYPLSDKKHNALSQQLFSFIEKLPTCAQKIETLFFLVTFLEIPRQRRPQIFPFLEKIIEEYQQNYLIHDSRYSEIKPDSFYQIYLNALSKKIEGTLLLVMDAYLEKKNFSKRDLLQLSIEKNIKELIILGNNEDYQAKKSAFKNCFDMCYTFAKRLEAQHAFDAARYYYTKAAQQNYVPEISQKAYEKLILLSPQSSPFSQTTLELEKIYIPEDNNRLFYERFFTP